MPVFSGISKHLEHLRHELGTLKFFLHIEKEKLYDFNIVCAIDDPVCISSLSFVKKQKLCFLSSYFCVFTQL